MKRLFHLLPLFVFCLFLMGQDDCDEQPPPPPPPEVKKFCAGSELSVRQVNRKAKKGEEGYSVIKHGEPSTDPYATVLVYFGSSRCTGVVVGPKTVLTAAHCGWAAEDHRIYDDFPGNGGNLLGTTTSRKYHPDYLKWEQNGDQQKREADVMLLYFDEAFSIDPVNIYQHEIEWQLCTDVVAQGYGVTEDPVEVPCPDGKSRCLREGSISVDGVDVGYLNPEGRLLKTGQRSTTKICFGDSGGAVYCMTETGPKVCGITSTTASQDCELYSHHVHVGNTEIKTWIYENMNGPE